VFRHRWLSASLAWLSTLSAATFSAYNFLVGQKTGTWVFIKTVKSDKYDRYLGDVFYTDKTGKQVYLNNLLLENGHAVRVRD